MNTITSILLQASTAWFILHGSKALTSNSHKESHRYIQDTEVSSPKRVIADWSGTSNNDATQSEATQKMVVYGNTVVVTYTVEINGVKKEFTSELYYNTTVAQKERPSWLFNWETMDTWETTPIVW